MEVLGPDGGPTVYAGGPAEFRVTLAAGRPVSGRQVKLTFSIGSQLGDRLATLVTSWDPESTVRTGEIADGTAIRCTVPELPLRPGKYQLSLRVERAGELLDEIEGQIEFELAPADYFGAGELPGESQGPILVRQRWMLEESAIRNSLADRV